MGLINWIFDFYQQHRINQLQNEAVRARKETASVRDPSGNIDVVRLERVLGELALAVKTVQGMMIEKGVCNSEEFYNKLRQLDLQDGKADGRIPID